VRRNANSLEFLFRAWMGFFVSRLKVALVEGFVELVIFDKPATQNFRYYFAAILMQSGNILD